MIENKYLELDEIYLNNYKKIFNIVLVQFYFGKKKKKKFIVM